MAISTSTKNLGGRIREKPREKHSMASPSRVFHSVFLEYGHLGFFVLVDSATLREYKLLNSYLQMSIYELIDMVQFVSKRRPLCNPID